MSIATTNNRGKGKKKPRIRGRAYASDGEDDVLPPLIPQRFPVCQCCFEDIPYVMHDNDIIQCSTGRHCFCRQCVVRYTKAFCSGEPYTLVNAEENSSEKTESSFQCLPCLSGQCNRGFFSHSLIQQTSDAETWGMYQERIILGRLVDSVDSRSCEKVHSDSAPENLDTLDEKTDSKPRSLKKPPAYSLPCDHGERIIERPKTESDYRVCPSCHTRFLKKFVLSSRARFNRVRCPSCPTCICYGCNQEVSETDESHFCLHSIGTPCPHNCGKCMLWTTCQSNVKR